MIKISDLINKFKKTETSEVTASTNVVAAQQEVKQLRNWYEERYDNITVQRNLLFLAIFLENTHIIMASLRSDLF